MTFGPGPRRRDLVLSGRSSDPERMPRLRRSSISCLALSCCGAAAAPAAGGLLDRSYRPLAGKAPVNLGKTYGGDVVLVVNTASKCGYTPQFEALEALHAKYRGEGFAVLGFPSGDFKAQEFEDEKQIQEFCTLTYGVKFPMFQKVHVVGAEATPLYRDLAQASGEAPSWNFHKYLIGRDGQPGRQLRQQDHAGRSGAWWPPSRRR